MAGYIGNFPTAIPLSGTDIADGTITNSDLANSSLTVNGTTISLGGSETITAGKIGQVVSNNWGDRITTSSSTFVDVPSSETSIVTSASSSKVLLHISLAMRKENNTYSRIHLYRKIGSGSYSKISNLDFGYLYTNTTVTQSGRFAVSILDSPSSADTIYYKIQINSGANIATIKQNPDASETSNITLMEVLA